MSKVPDFNGTAVRSVPGAPPRSEWIDQLLVSRDEQLKALTSFAQTDPLNFEVVSVPFLDQKPVLVRSQKIRGPITAALLLSSSPNDPDEIVFTPGAVGECSIEAFFDEPPTNPVPVKLLLFGL